MFPGRTTDALVRGICNVQATTVLDPFIDAANDLVTEKCAIVFPGTLQQYDSALDPVYVPAPGGFQYSAHRLELIETWLAAHFYCIFNPQPTAERVGTVTENFQHHVNVGFDGTMYGQQAMRLDTMGALAVMNNGQRKFRKLPPAIGVGVNIGATYLGSRCRRGPVYGGGWQTGF